MYVALSLVRSNLTNKIVKFILARGFVEFHQHLYICHVSPDGAGTCCDLNNKKHVCVTTVPRYLIANLIRLSNPSWGRKKINNKFQHENIMDCIILHGIYYVLWVI
jgi:hypothetical protein